jgi:hypothetical protein
VTSVTVSRAASIKNKRADQPFRIPACAYLCFKTVSGSFLVKSPCRSADGENLVCIYGEVMRNDQFSDELKKAIEE